MRRAVIAPLLALCATSCSDPLPPDSGAVIWRVAGSSAGTPAFDATTVYFLARNHEVVALNKQTGDLRWRRSTGMLGGETAGGTALVLGSAVIVGDGDVHAFSRSTGAHIWQFRPSVGYLPGLFDLATNGTLIFAGSPSGHVYAITGDGRSEWQVDLKDTDEEVSAYHPVYADGLVFACFRRWSWPTTGGIVALDARTGVEQWRRDFPALPPNHQAGCFAQVGVTQGVVAGASDDGHIHAYQALSGEPAWSAPQLENVGEAGSPQMDLRHLAAGEGMVVIGSTTSWVVGLDAVTGAEKWRNSPQRGSIVAPIAVLGGAAYTVGGALELTSFDLLTGSVRWQRGSDAKEPYTARPAVDGDRIYIGGPDHMSALRR
jgi:outer membrane protein assembly factor BamB